MASQGPRYPGTTGSEVGPSGDNDWISTSPIGADDGSEAQITAATFDSGDASYRLKASNFGFSVSGTIDGIIVEIDRRCFAGTARDDAVRLYNGAGSIVGDDKAITSPSWPASLGIATYGSSSDTWAAGLTADDINSPNFGVGLIAVAQAANTDIGVDFIRVTVHYTPPAGNTGTGAVTAAPASVSATGKQTFRATGAVAAPASSVAATGKLSFGATGALSAPAAEVDGSGTLAFSGTGAISAAAATIEGTGSLPDGDITGTGAIAAPAAVISGTSALAFRGSGAVAAAPATLSATGKETFSSSGAVVAAASTLAASGDLAFSGTGAVTAAAGTLSGAGVVETVEIEGTVTLADESGASVTPVEGVYHAVLVLDEAYYAVELSDE